MKLVDLRVENLEERVAPGLSIGGGISIGIGVGVGVGGEGSGCDTHDTGSCSCD